MTSPARSLPASSPRTAPATPSSASRDQPTAEVPLAGIPAPAEVLLDLLGSDALRSRAFVTRRYDQLVQSRTVRRPGLDAAVLRLRPSYRGLALTLDGTGRLGSLDPFTGGAAAILEAARNVACAGGEPLGFTDCLNFGNPEKPEIGWELAESIEGMAQACEALGLPIVSGQRLALQRHRRPLDPPDPRRRLRRPRAGRAARAGQLEARATRSCSRRPGPRRCRDRSSRPATAPSPARRRPSTSPAEAALVRFVAEAAPRCSLAHDVSDGGLAVALAEAALHSGVGARLDLPLDPVTLFGEGRGQVILALPADQVETDPLGSDVAVRRIGEVGGDEILGVELARLRAVWEGEP